MADIRVEAALKHAIGLGEVGVQVAAYLGEELIVDEWVGLADPATARPVEGETLFPVFSVSKAIVATAVHLQVERGLVDLDATVATYWPEYAAEGKGKITIRHVLTHRAGVPQMPPNLTLDGLADWDEIVSYLALVEPVCPPGERSMYHSVSFGYILGEVVRRTDPQHRLFADFLHDEICAPLDIKDLWVGLPPEQEHRVATLTWGADPPKAPQVAPNPIRTMSMPAAISPSPQVFNSSHMHQACVPAASGIMTAHDGAKFFSLLANGGALGGTRLISKARLLALTEPRPNPLELDEGIGMVAWMGMGGYWLGGTHPPADPVVGTGPHILAHGGAGGSIAWADLDTGLAVMIAHNRMFGAVALDAHPFVALGEAARAVAGEHR